MYNKVLHGFLFCGSPLGGAAESFISAVVSSGSFELGVDDTPRSSCPKFLLVGFFIHLVEASRGFNRSCVIKCFFVYLEGKGS